MKAPLYFFPHFQVVFFFTTEPTDRSVYYVHGVAGKTMPPQTCCLACGSDMRNRSLLSHYLLKPYRVCPDCNAKYTADRKTKKRLVLVVILAVFSLASTTAIVLKGPVWVLPSILTSIVLLAYVGYVIVKISWVRYPD